MTKPENPSFGSVDGQESITIHYNDGRMAVLSHSIYSRSDRQGIIYGDKGYMVVDNINNPKSVSIYDTFDDLIEYKAVPKQISGYEYQFEEAARLIAEGKTESCSMPLDETIRVMEICDFLRKSWNFCYPGE